MHSSYNKIQYNDCPGFQLHHTIGPDAASSTKNYPHLNTDKMLLYWIHGSGNIIIDGKTYPIHAGDIIHTSPAQMYHCTVDGCKYHERIVLHISQEFFDRFSCDTAFLQQGISNHIPGRLTNASQLPEKFAELLNLVQQTGPASDILAVCKVAEILVLLKELSGSVPTGNDTLSENPLIDRVLVYLNENFIGSITVDTVAKQFHITASYLSHQFKQHTGLSVWNYVLLRRLHLANAHIRQGLSTEEACYQAGFDNYANFFRLYKKYMGITPSQFKKQQ